MKINVINFNYYQWKWQNADEFFKQYAFIDLILAMKNCIEVGNNSK